MRRREFIALMAAATLSFPRLGLSQISTDLPLVGILYPGPEDLMKVRVAALRKGLQEAGFVEGKNYSLAVRFANGDQSRLPALAKEIGELKPSVIVVGVFFGIAHEVLPDTPMVFTGVAVDPIASGLVTSYARPGVLITGNVLNAFVAEAKD